MLEVGWMDGDDRIKNIQETQLFAAIHYIKKNDQDL